MRCTPIAAEIAIRPAVARRGRGFEEVVVQGDPKTAVFYEGAGGARVGKRFSASIPGRESPLFRIRLWTLEIEKRTNFRYEKVSARIRSRTMKPGKLVGLVLMAAGGALLYFGINAAESPLESLSQTLTGRYSDQTMTYLIGGGVSALAGLAMLFKGR